MSCFGEMDANLMRSSCLEATRDERRAVKLLDRRHVRNGELRAFASPAFARGASQAVASIERYFSEELDQRIGNIAAGALLGFFLEEIGPAVYNQAVAQVQERLQERLQELDIEFNEDEFQYWRRRQASSKPRR